MKTNATPLFIVVDDHPLRCIAKVKFSVHLKKVS